MTPQLPWHLRDAPTERVTPASQGTRSGRSQAALAFGDRHAVFGREAEHDGWTPEAYDSGRVVETWGASRKTTKTRPVHMKVRSRRRR